MRASGARCPVYLAVPRLGGHLLDCVLKDVGLLGAGHVRRIEVPDVLLREVRNEYRR